MRQVLALDASPFGIVEHGRVACRFQQYFNHPYLSRVTANVLADARRALTGCCRRLHQPRWRRATSGRWACGG